jgi:cysteine-rich repeat protein
MGTPRYVHDGLTDPSTAGWTLVGPGTGVAAGPIAGDRGLDAWNVDDNSTASGSTLTYVIPEATLAGDLAEAAADGWTLRLRLRVVEIPDGTDFSVQSEFADGSTRWNLRFGSDAWGNPILQTIGGTTVDLSDLDDGYHWYELTFDPDAGTADLFVDGTLRLTDDPGGAIALTRLNFGSGQSSTVGRGHYAYVEWFPLTCGNGTLDAGEQCDDDNLADDDGCSAICTVE